jgi:hypothetical protein
MKAKYRFQSTREQLPEFFETISSSLRSGGDLFLGDAAIPLGGLEQYAKVKIALRTQGEQVEVELSLKSRTDEQCAYPPCLL